MRSLVPPRLFLVQPQRDALKQLWTQADVLSKGDFCGQMGLSSKTLVGAKGIGKTGALRTFTQFANSIFDGAIPILISFNTVETCESFRKPLLQLILQELEVKWNLEISCDQTVRPYVVVLRALKKAKKRLYIIVDELD